MFPDLLNIQMDFELLDAVASLTALIIAIGGWIVSYNIQTDFKERARLENRVKRLEQEIGSRMYLEKASCERVAELTGKTLQSVKLDLRKRCYAKYRTRPQLSPSDLNL